jgi:hypothetical protein
MAFSFVQFKDRLAGPNPGTSVTLTFTSSTVSGNSIIFAVSTFAGSSSVTDNKSNTYTKIGTMTEPNTTKIIDVWYAYNIVGGASHILTVVQGSDAGIEMLGEEWSGLGNITPFDKATSATGSATTADSGSTATTTYANELIWSTSYIYGDSNDFGGLTVTAGSGYSNLHSTTPGGQTLYTESKTVTTTGTYNATYSIAADGSGFLAGSPRWATMVLTFGSKNFLTLPATETSVVSLKKQVPRTLAVIAVGLISISRQLGKVFTVTTTPVASLAIFTGHQIILGVATSPIAILAKRLIFKRSLAAATTPSANVGRLINKVLNAIATSFTNIVANKRVPDIGNKGRIRIPKLNKKPWVK